MAKKSYNEDSIEVLQGLEGCRRKPTMYLGERGDSMVYNAIKEFIDNATDEHMAGRNNRVQIYIDNNTSTYIVADDAEGIPVGKNRQTGESTLTVIFTRLHAGGKFDDKDYSSSVGCFVGEQTLQLADGEQVSFKDLYTKWVAGHKTVSVCSVDTSNGETRNNNVYHVQLSKYVTRLCYITLSNDEVIKCTLDHPFYLSDRTCMAAEYLLGQSLLGEGVTVTDVKIVDVKQTPVYGISVDRDHTYMLSAGVYVGNTHGVGSAAANAVAKSLDVWTKRNKQWYHQRYEEGVPVHDVKKQRVPSDILDLLPVTKNLGTVLRYCPDQNIVSVDANRRVKTKKKAVLDARRLLLWMRGVTNLNPGLIVNTRVKTAKGIKNFEYVNTKGLQHYVNELIKEEGYKKLGSKMLLLESKSISMALQWTDHPDVDQFRTYVNSSPTHDHGSHEKGFVDALTRALHPHRGKDKFKMRDALNGLVGVFNWRMSEAEFQGQLKSKLVSNCHKDIEQQLLPVLEDYFEKNKTIPRQLIKRAVAILKGRAQLKTLMKSVSEVKKSKRGLTLPNILYQSTKARPEDIEIFIVEGDSASGTAKLARYHEYQEVLKLTGKIRNALRTPLHILLANTVIQNILVALGIDVKTLDTEGDFSNMQFKTDKLRVGRVYLLSDADEDGCLRSNTRVMTLDGTNPTIKELADKWKKDHEPVEVYTRNSKGELTIAKAKRPRKTVTVNKTITLFFDNDTHVECTLDHKWKVNFDDRKVIHEQGHRYLQAKDLRIGDGIDSMYTAMRRSDGDRSQDNYLCILGEKGSGCDRDTMPAHQFVKRCINKRRFNRYRRVNKGVLGGARHIHHIDHNTTNNSPSNLQYLNKGVHCAHHLREMALEYNGSDKHLEDIARFQATPAGARHRKMASKALIRYNKRQAKKETNRKLNNTAYHKYRVALGRVSRMYYGFIIQDIPITASNWRTATSNAEVNGIPGLHKAKALFKKRELLDYIDERLDESDATYIDLSPTIKSSYPTQCLSKFLRVCKLVVDKGMPLTEGNYKFIRERRTVRGDPKWGTGLQHAGTSSVRKIRLMVQDYSRKKKKRNHTIVDIQINHGKKDMYCMTVPSTGNFMVDDGKGNGICSANSHINTLCLALIYRLIPDLIKEGRVFVIDAPLFNAFYKNKRYFGPTHEDCHKSMPKGAPEHIIVRAKGWGEVDADVLRFVAFAPESRKVIKVLYPKDTESQIYFEGLVGENVSLRKQLLGL